MTMRSAGSCGAVCMLWPSFVHLTLGASFLRDYRGKRFHWRFTGSLCDSSCKLPLEGWRLCGCGCGCMGGMCAREQGG